MNDKERKKMMDGADKILDDYNDGKLTLEQMKTCLEPISAIMRSEEQK